MRPTFAVGIEYAVAVDDLVIPVFEKRKVVVSGGTLLQFFDELF